MFGSKSKFLHSFQSIEKKVSNGKWIVNETYFLLGIR